MKIQKVKWKDHPILKDLMLGFIDGKSGQPFETITFAGENGTGKSTVLEEISSFLNKGSFAHFEYIEYIVDGKVYKAIPTSDGNTLPTFFDVVASDGSIKKIRNRPRKIRKF
jgi:ATPase subunit of ABC transporter with duplicated ATPase domains